MNPIPMRLPKVILLLLSALAFVITMKAQSNPFHYESNKEYIGFKMNYGFRPLFREKSIIDVGIDSADNRFDTYVYDQYAFKAIQNMKGLSLGLEYGYNNFFVEGQFDFAIRNHTYLLAPNVFVGYNITFMQKHPVAFRPAIGLNYNWLWTELGKFPSNSPDYRDIYVTQSNALIGVRPRMQVEIPVIKMNDDALVFLRVEAGYQFSEYTSRFVKLKAERTYENANGNTKTDSERFYLDGEKSGYLINGKHLNKTPTSYSGFYYCIELAVKIATF